MASEMSKERLTQKQERALADWFYEHAMCPECHGPITRFHERDGHPYKYCSAACDRAATGRRVSKTMKRIWNDVAGQ